MSSSVAIFLHTPLQIHRISFHRGPVSGILVAGACDVLISASHDKNICVWDLENYALLNTMQMTSPVLRIDISWNSVSDTHLGQSWANESCQSRSL